MKEITDETILKLSDEALLAILLTSERGKYFSVEMVGHLLKSCQGGLYGLLSKDILSLSSLTGLSWQDAIKLKVAVEIQKRKQLSEVLEKPKINRSDQIYELFSHLEDMPYEEFWIVILNRANRIICTRKISEGGLAGTHVDPRRIFHETIKAKGTAIVLVHNHPSGNIEPSDADKEITKKISDAGKLLVIQVLDHLIIGQNQYYSFSDNELI
jgi:DNA repair protein RadC